MQEKAQQEVGSGRSHSVKGRNECLLINDGAFIGTPAPSAGREPTLHPGPRNGAPLGGHLLTVPACRWDALGGHHVVLPIFACLLLEVCPRVPVPVVPAAWWTECLSVVANCRFHILISDRWSNRIIKPDKEHIWWMIFTRSSQTKHQTAGASRTPVALPQSMCHVGGCYILLLP